MAALAVMLLLGYGYLITHWNCKPVVKDGICYVREGILQKKSDWMGTVDVPAGVSGIGDHAFYGCTSLTGIRLPQEVTTIGDSAFYDCLSLSGIRLPEGLTSIGYHAFNGCDNLKTITMTNSQKNELNFDVPEGMRLWKGFAGLYLLSNKTLIFKLYGITTVPTWAETYPSLFF